jgi:hypothetical protein
MEVFNPASRRESPSGLDASNFSCGCLMGAGGRLDPTLYCKDEPVDTAHVCVLGNHTEQNVQAR